MRRSFLTLAVSTLALGASVAPPAAQDAAQTANDIASHLPGVIDLPTAPPPDLAPIQPRAALPDAAKPIVVEAPNAAVVAPAAEAPAVDPAVAAKAQLATALKAAADSIDVTRLAGEQKRERAAIADFYKARAGEPLFVTGTGLSDAGNQLMERLGRAGDDGLRAADYKVALPRDGAPTGELLATELSLAEAALKYARHAQAGRFAPTQVSDLVTPKLDIPDPVRTLAALAESRDVSQTLQGFNPPHEGYAKLRAKLAELRANPLPLPPPQVMVPAGATLKPGMKDARVVLLRQRLAVPAGDGVDPELYDEQVQAQVILFQKDRDLGASGIVGPATIAALNRKEESKIATEADLIVNMERWRWLPRDLGSLNVFVNIPGFYLDINQKGQSIHHTRVIVGRVANATPVFSETMTHIIVNPYWNVPVSILKKEMLGNIQASGGAYLDRGNYEVVINNKVVASNMVDWATINPNAVTVRQRPGGGNALGNVKFMFPNQHSVYLHDTSSRSLFAQDQRSLSHGCVRVFEPFNFADKLLVEEPGGLTGQSLKAMVGGPEKTMWLKRKLQVHLTYFTTTVDAKGQLEFRRDLYGYDGRMKQIMGL